jgi:hypothetical protein
MFGFGMPELMILAIAVSVVYAAVKGIGGGSVKRCVFCQSNIPKQAVVCRHCQRDQPS